MSRRLPSSLSVSFSLFPSFLSSLLAAAAAGQAEAGCCAVYRRVTYLFTRVEEIPAANLNVSVHRLSLFYKEPAIKDSFFL